MKHIVDNLNKMPLRIKTLDLAGRVQVLILLNSCEWNSIIMASMDHSLEPEFGMPATALNKWKASPSIYTKAPSLPLSLSKRRGWKKNSRRLVPKSLGLYMKTWQRVNAHLGCHRLPIKDNWKLSDA